MLPACLAVVASPEFLRACVSAGGHGAAALRQLPEAFGVSFHQEMRVSVGANLADVPLLPRTLSSLHAQNSDVYLCVKNDMFGGVCLSAAGFWEHSDGVYISLGLFVDHGVRRE